MYTQMASHRSKIHRALAGLALAALAVAVLQAGERRPSRAPASDLSTAYAFPVPFKPSATSTRITFTNLSSEATIRIFSATGELVRTLNEEDGDGFIRWDVTNEQGAPVASDVYFYVIENAEQTKAGKLLVVR